MTTWQHRIRQHYHSTTPELYIYTPTTLITAKHDRDHYHIISENGNGHTINIFTKNTPITEIITQLTPIIGI